MKTLIVRTLGLRGASAQRSLCGEPLVFVGGRTSIRERVKIYYSEVKRWKRLNKRLPIIAFYQRKKGTFFDCSFFCFGNVLGNLQGELQGAEHTSVIYCIIWMFRYTSPSNPTLMASKPLMAELQSVCLQIDKPEDPFLAVWLCEEWDLYLSIWLETMALPIFIHICLVSSFFRG